MAGPYHVNAGGSNTAPYDTFAKAAPTLVSLLASVTIADGEFVYILSTNDEVLTSSTIFHFVNGIESNPIKIISCTTGYVYDPGAHIRSSGGTLDISLGTGSTVWHGVNMSPTDDFSFIKEGTIHKFRDLTISANDRMISMTDFSIFADFYRCTLISADLNQNAPYFSRERCGLALRNCVISMPNADVGKGLIRMASAATCTKVIIDACDFSSCASDMAFVQYDALNAQQSTEIHFRRSKLPVGITMPAHNDADNYIRVERCSSASASKSFLGIGGVDGGTSMWRGPMGDVRDATTQNRVGGAQDYPAGGTGNNFSREMISHTTTNFYSPLVSPPMSFWAKAEAQTVTIHTATDADLNDNELWMTVEHPDSSVPAYSIHDMISTAPEPLATPAVVTRDAGSAWNGSGTGSDGSTGQQKLVSGSFTPAIAGPCIVKVYLAKPSTTLFVDPKPVVT